MKTCCNHDCDQGRERPLRKAERCVSHWEAALYVGVAALVLFLLTACQSAKASEFFEPMSDADIVRQLAITATLAIDHHQSQQIRQIREAAPPGSPQISEGNPLVRRHFSEVGIRNYFLVAAVGSAVITKALPPQWRPAFQYGMLALQVAVIVKNKRMGLSIAF